ncbi:hypothetical protein [Pseudomonas sp. Z4-20]|uniref:hypothetical protein n=1 Tax=Pseudomonas sp. Z4-20 TaxID=2817414 RepID=UPI003DA87C9E
MNSATPDDLSTEILSGPQQEEREKTKSALEKESEILKSRLIKERHDNVSVRTDTLTVNKGNFRGELTFQYSFVGGYFDFKTLQYRITRFNGQSGGNKANINLHLWNEPSDWRSNSPDAMWQDGKWHNYEREANLREWGWITVWAEFIFDKGGGDPSGPTYKQYYPSI